MRLYAGFFKRAIDFTGALCLVLALLPVYAVCYILIRINMGSPVLFRQERPGKGGKIFRIYKFRSMNSARGADGNLLPDKDRVTKLGAFLRGTSLDEIPQFFNVLKGDMSFIGPRPLLPEYLPYYTQREAARHNVRPGITGLAQVSGRNNLSWDDKLELDARYVENITFLGDMKIVLKTIKNVLAKKDVEISKEISFAEHRKASKKGGSL